MNPDQEITKAEYQIFTDNNRTKDLLWDYYTAYLEFYGSYVMYMKQYSSCPPEVIAGLNRYAAEFYNESEYFYKQFEEKIGKDKITKIKELFLDNKEKLGEKDYYFIRKFFNLFMCSSGIKNILREIQDPSNAIKQSR